MHSTMKQESRGQPQQGWIFVIVAEHRLTLISFTKVSFEEGTEIVDALTVLDCDMSEVLLLWKTVCVCTDSKSHEVPNAASQMSKLTCMHTCRYSPINFECF